MIVENLSKALKFRKYLVLTFSWLSMQSTEQFTETKTILDKIYLYRYNEIGEFHLLTWEKMLFDQKYFYSLFLNDPSSIWATITLISLINFKRVYNNCEKWKPRKKIDINQYLAQILTKKFFFVKCIFQGFY